MSDLDKDIERVKEVINRLSEIQKKHSLNGFFLDEAKKEKEEIQAIENVLKELEELQDDLSIHEETSFEFQEENIKLRKELETYKKIAEWLAYELAECDFEYHCEHCRTDICSAYESNDEYTQCIIEWARNEVEKDE